MKHLLIGATLASLALVGAAEAKSTGYHAPRVYTSPPARQSAYANMGRTSTTTNLPMVKPVNGYVKRDGTYVNPYARSK